MAPLPVSCSLTPYPPTTDISPEVSSAEYVNCDWLFCLFASCFHFYIAFRHGQEHDRLDTEYIRTEHVTRAQLAALRDWAESRISSLTQEHNNEIRSQKDWVQEFVSERLREHHSFMDGRSIGYSTMSSTPSSVAGRLYEQTDRPRKKKPLVYYILDKFTRKSLLNLCLTRHTSAIIYKFRLNFYNSRHYMQVSAPTILICCY